MSENLVFVLVQKEKQFDAHMIMLTAVSGDEVEVIYDVAKRNADKEYDIICYVYDHGVPVEVSIYEPKEEDFKVVLRYDGEEE